MSEDQSLKQQVSDSGPTQPVEMESTGEMLTAVTPKYQFKNEKNCYLTREEIYRLDNTNPIVLYSMANRDLNTIPTVVKSNNPQIIRQSYVVGLSINYAPEMHLDEMNSGLIYENIYDSVYRNGINQETGVLEKDCLARATYVPIEISKQGKRDFTQLFASGNKPLIHLEYFKRKVDQGILDRLSYWDIAYKTSKVNQQQSNQDEIFEFSFPILGQEKGKNPKGKKEKRYDFIKITVCSVVNPPNEYQTQFVIRTFRITNAKTHCTKRYFVGHYCEAYKEAAHIYRKAANGMLELYDLDNVNDFIALRIYPDDPKIRFIPDGYFKDEAYVHDRDTDKYYTMGEWRLIEKKKAKERMKNQIKTRKRKVPLNKIPIEVITEKQKEHKDVLDFLNSL